MIVPTHVASSKNAPANNAITGNLAPHGINGVSIRQVKVWGSTEFLLKTRFSHWNGDGNVRQSLLVAGCMNSTPLLGVVRVSSNGSCQWEGTQGVTVSTRGEGVLCVKLPVTLFEHLLVMSPNEFNHIV